MAYQPTPAEHPGHLTFGELVALAVIVVALLAAAAYGVVVLVQRHDNQLRARATHTHLLQYCNSTDLGTAMAAAINHTCPPGTRNYAG